MLSLLPIPQRSLNHPRQEIFLSSHSSGHGTATSTPTRTSATPPPPLWRNRDFVLIASGQAVSDVGTQVSHLAFPLLLLLLTGSPALAGLVGAARTIPYFLMALPAGALVDRWNRRTVMLVCDTGRALSLGSIPLAAAFNMLSLPQLYLVAFIEGLLGVVFDIAAVACLPRVVSREQLAQATSWQIAGSGGASLAGPPLGGLLYAIKATLPFLADAVSYAVSVLSLFFVRTPLQGERSGQREPIAQEIRTGLAWLWQKPTIRLLALLSGLLNLVAPGASALLVIVLAREQDAAPSLIGLIVAGTGIGYILGSLVTGAIRRRFTFAKIMLATCWLFPLIWGCFALARGNVFLLGVVSAAFAFIDPIYDITQFSYRMVLIPDALQGRVTSAYRVIARATPPLGLALTGILLQRAGALVTIATLGSALLAMAILATASRAIRAAPEHPNA
jgi:predicted MFS family arabinose efflux permease